MTDPRSRIPGVDRLLASAAFASVLADFPRSSVTARLREQLDLERARVQAGSSDPIEDPAAYAALVGRALVAAGASSLRRVINATGVVLHTNLGRAPLSLATREAMSRAAVGYSNLEFDLQEGARGSRYDHCVALLRERTGAEDALVVNNAAAALLLALSALARGREVLVSRGELIEIGGGFRIPEVIAAGGAALREVGATNRTRINDFRDAMDPGVGAILRVHRSNFQMLGFTEQAPLEALVQLAHEHGLPFVHDLGTGLLVPPQTVGLSGEATVQEAVAQGADVVVFSGDKLLGGPQAGVIVGTGEAVARMRRDPLCRAIRTDKVTLAGLEATLKAYEHPDRAREEIPILRMLSASEEELCARARRMAAAVTGGGTPAGIHVDVVTARSLVGGGTLPGVELPTCVVRISLQSSADGLALALRTGTPSLVGRVEGGALLLDPRTILDQEEAEVVEAVRRAVSMGPLTPSGGLE